MARIFTDGWKLHDNMEVLAKGRRECSDNSSQESYSTQLGISSGILTCPSFTSSSAEGVGEDSFPNIRYPHRHRPGGRAHLPEYEEASSKMIKFGLLRLLYRFLQFVHRLTLVNLNREGPELDI
jgi:hypothetical protein